MKPLTVILLACAAACLLAPGTFVSSAQDGACGSAPLPRLQVGRQGQVTPGGRLNVRDAAPSGSRVGQIAVGARFAVLEGPVCMDGLNWYRVDADEADGWIAEGDDYSYWAVPVVFDGQPITPQNAGALSPLTAFACADANLPPQLATLSADGTRLAFRCGEDALTVIDLLTNTRLDFSGAQVEGLVFSPRDGTLVGVDENPDGNRLYVWDSSTGTLLGMQPLPGGVPSVHGRYVVLQTLDRLTLLDVTMQDTALTYEQRSSQLGTVAVGSDGALLALLSVDPDATDPNDAQQITVFGMDVPGATLTPRFAVTLTDSQVIGLAFSPSGRSLVATVCDGVIGIEQCEKETLFWYSSETGDELAAWDIAPFLSSNVAIAPDGKMLALQNWATGGWRLYDVEIGDVLNVPAAQGMSVDALAFSADGQRVIVATGGAEAQVILFGVP